VAGTLVLGLICCGGASIIAFKHYQSSQRRTPEGAATEYFQAIRFKDTGRMKDALCSQKRDDAKKDISAFYARLDSAGFTLKTLSWIPAGKLREVDNEQVFNGEVDLTVLRGQQHFDLSIGYRLTLTHHFFSWYVCGAQVTG
jgi:hypothetical protein